MMLAVCDTFLPPGKLATLYLLQHYGHPAKDFSWAITSRSKEKIPRLSREVGKGVEEVREFTFMEFCFTCASCDLQLKVHEYRILTSLLGFGIVYGTGASIRRRRDG